MRLFDIRDAHFFNHQRKPDGWRNGNFNLAGSLTTAKVPAACAVARATIDAIPASHGNSAGFEQMFCFIGGEGWGGVGADLRMIVAGDSK